MAHLKVKSAVKCIGLRIIELEGALLFLSVVSDGKIG